MSDTARPAPEDALGVLLGARVVSLRPLAGGCVGDVRLATLADGRRVVAKRAEAEGAAPLACEAFMLRWLRERTTLPVPHVLGEAPGLLAMEFVENDGAIDASVERHAADLLADLHALTPDAVGAVVGESVASKRFGFERDTVIGALAQPNPWASSWVSFFRESRLLHMGRECARAGRLDAAALARLERFCARLGDFIGEPPAPSLVHGDVWAGNVLARAGRVAAFIDPAIYFAHAEVELAFVALFSTFGRPFYDRYAERRPVAPGFFEPARGQRLARRDVYNLYPLLVHARLFGGSYAGAVSDTLSRAGF